MRELIQTEFLTPLAEVFGHHGPRLADELAKRIPPTIDSDAMRSAAERLIRTRRAKGFPPFPECLAALTSAQPLSGAGSGVTAQNYPLRAVEFCRANYRADEWPVIDRIQNPDEWRAWRDYFGRIGMRGSHRMMENASRWGVPAMTPREFDAGERGIRL